LNAIVANTTAHIYAREEQILAIIGWSCWKNKFRTGLLNSFSSVDHHAFSDNSVDPCR